MVRYLFYTIGDLTYQSPLVALQIYRTASCICRCSSDNSHLPFVQNTSKSFIECYQIAVKTQHQDTRTAAPQKISGLLRPFKDVLGLNLQTYSTSLASAAELTCLAWPAAPTTNCKPQEVSDHMVEPVVPNQSSVNAVGNVTILVCTVQYTECHRRKGPNFGRVFLMLNYTDITQNTYIQSWTVTEIMAGEKCGHLTFPRNVRLQLWSALTVRLWRHKLRPTR